MKKIINLFDTYFFEIILTTLVTIAFYNGYCNIGLLYDGSWYILNAIQNTPAIDHSRFIVSFLLSTPTFFFNLTNINNVTFIHIITFLYGTWFYILPLFPIIFLNYFLPKQEKNYLIFVVISYLLSMIFSSYFIASEVYITTFLYWFILLSVSLLDFKKNSVLKKIMLLTICFISIFSYQIFFIYSLILMIVIIVKKKKNLYTSIVFLLILVATVTTFYYTINANDTNSSKFLSNLYSASTNMNCLQYVIISFALLSIINYKRKFINIFYLVSLSVILFFFILNNISLISNAHDSRTLTPVVTLIFSVFFVFLYLFNKNINFHFAKYVIIVLLFIYSVNTLLLNNKINITFNECIYVLKKEKQLIIPIDIFIKKITNKENITDIFVFPRQLILIQLLYSNNKNISKIVYNSNFDKNNDFNPTNIDFIKELNTFGVKYSTTLLKEIDRI